MSKSDPATLEKLKNWKNKAKTGGECMDLIQKGIFEQLLGFLSAANAATDIIDLSLDVFVRIAWHCFGASVPLDTRALCVENLNEVDGYNRLFSLYNTLTSENHKEQVVIILARFYDHTRLNPDHVEIIGALIKIIESIKDREKELGRLNHTICSLISLSAHAENKFNLISSNVVHAMVPLLVHKNFCVGENAAIVIQNSCLVREPTEKQRVLQSSDLFTSLHATFLSFSKARSSERASPFPVVVKWLAAAVFSVVNNNPEGIAEFLATPLVPVLVTILHTTASSSYVPSRSARPSAVTEDEKEAENPTPAPARLIFGSEPPPLAQQAAAVCALQGYIADAFLSCSLGGKENIAKLAQQDVVSGVLAVVHETTSRIEKRKNTKEDDDMLCDMLRLLNNIVASGSKEVADKKARNAYAEFVERVDGVTTLVQLYTTITLAERAGAHNATLTTVKSHAAVSFGHVFRAARPDARKHGLLLEYLQSLFKDVPASSTKPGAVGDGSFNFAGVGRVAWEKIQDAESVLKEYLKSIGKK